MSEKIIFIIPKMVGGGAERVAAQLMNRFSELGFDTLFLLTSCKKEELVRCDLKEEIPLTLIAEELKGKNSGVKNKLASVMCKPFELVGKKVPADFAKFSIEAQYEKEIEYVRQVLIVNPTARVIAFLQPAIPITLLAARGLPNKVIISERADPYRLLKKRYGENFIRKYYTRADMTVFQTVDAQNAYPKEISKKSTVILNPIKPGLPEIFTGERSKRIVTFCRISKQKNLPMLITAFSYVLKKHPDYTLTVIGDAPNIEGEEVLAQLKAMISELNIQDNVEFLPFSKNVHAEIVGDAMYVNSSDYEGISNAMLEAMAIGMPVVCTDCPIGGAKTVINDGKNGLLVPVGDAQKTAEAMCRIIENKGLAENLGKNASLIREKLSLESITSIWTELL